MTDIFFHLGFMKTASSTLQEYYFKKNKNVNFLGKNINGNNKIFFKFNNLFFNEKILPEEVSNFIINNFSISKNKINVISQEAFTLPFRYNDSHDFLFSLDRIKKISIILKSKLNLDTKILLVVKPQDKFLISCYGFYSHKIDSNTISNLDQLIEIFFEKQKLSKNYFLSKLFYLFDYYEVSKKIEEYFGKDNMYILRLDDNISENLNSIFGDNLNIKDIFINRSIRVNNIVYKRVKKNTINLHKFKIFLFIISLLKINKIRIFKNLYWLINSKLSFFLFSKKINYSEIKIKKFLKTFEQSNNNLDKFYTYNIKKKIN